MEKQNPPPYSPPYQPPPPGFTHHPPPGFTHQPPQDFSHHPPPPHPQQQTVVITNVTTVPLGPTPCTITCPSCRAHIVTSVETHPSTKTHLFAFLCCIFGGWLCCCIPYCMDSCQSQTHTCPNCGAFIGEYNN